jgi:hypothetical protein
MPHEIWGYHRVIALEQGYDLLPGFRAAGDPVDEENRRTSAGAAKADIVTVDPDMLKPGRVRFGRCSWNVDAEI